MINRLKKISSSFPNNTGIYKFLSDSEILYIGKAKNLKKRINSYFSGKQTYKTQKLISWATSLEYVTTNNEVEALLLEQNLIKSEQPKFNKIAQAYNYSVNTDKLKSLGFVPKIDFDEGLKSLCV